MRLGMAGTLAYELHGATADGPEVYDAVVRAGKPHEIERLGWQTFQVNHVEGGFPQQFWTFTPSVHDHEGGTRRSRKATRICPNCRHS